MAQKQSHTSHGNPEQSQAETRGDRPQKGEHYRCETCGMEIDVTAECHCESQDGPHFECCGHELAKV